MSLLSIFQKMMHHGDLQHAMMEKLGVREALIDRPGSAPVMRRAVNRCLSCEAVGDCEQWLESHETADHAPSFCRNSELFERLKHEIEAEAAHAH